MLTRAQSAFEALRDRAMPRHGRTRRPRTAKTGKPKTRGTKDDRKSEAAKNRDAALSGPYAARPYYRNNLKGSGWQDADFADGCSDRLVDAIVAWGSEAQILERLAAHLKAGATHACLQTLRLDGKPLPDLHAIEVLALHK
jgi:hypothetical protein